MPTPRLLSCSHVNDDFHWSRWAWLIDFGRFLIAKDDIDDAVESVSKLLAFVGFAREIDLVPDARNSIDTSYRHKVYSTPLVNIVELDTAHRADIAFVVMFPSLVDIPKGPIKNGNTEDGNYICDETEWIGPLKVHAKTVV